MIFYLFLIATIILFILLHAVIFPRLFFHIRSVMKNNDRAVKDISEDNGGRTIIYEPENKFRGIIKHYALSRREDGMTLTCEVDKDLRYIDYDVRMFNGKGEVFKVLNVKEVLSGDGIAKTVDIDERTVYVSVIVNRCDGKIYTQKKMRYKVSSGMLALYFAVCSVLDILSVFVFKICIAEIFGGIFHESFIFSLTGTIFTGILCVAVIVINIVLTLIILKNNSTVKVVNGEYNG